jgi:hypothetical protein
MAKQVVSEYVRGSDNTGFPQDCSGTGALGRNSILRTQGKRWIPGILSIFQ